MPDVAAYPLPIDIGAITNAWLTAALRTRAPGVTVRRHDVIDINSGTCTKIRLRLDLDEAGRAAGIPELVILKGGFEPHSRHLWYMHESEVRGYTDVLPDAALRSPACYFAGFDAERAQGIIIMDDLVARGVTFCHPQRPQTPDQVAYRLGVLARHHARTWGSADLEPGGRFAWAMEAFDNARMHFGPMFAADNWRHYVDSPRGAAASVRFHDGVWLREALDKLYRYSLTVPQSLIHGDTHLGNLYIDIDGEPGFFDSLPQRAPAMYEVAYHVTCALDLADRPIYEDELVRGYAAELARHGVAVPPHEELMRQFGIFLALGYCVFILNSSEFQLEAINTAYTARFSAAMLDHDTKGLIAVLP
jgi:hypothetical protein